MICWINCVVQSQKRHRTVLGFAHPLARNARPDWAGRPICHFFAAYDLRSPRLAAWGESPRCCAPRATAFCPSPERVGSLAFGSLKTQLPEALASLTSGTHGGASLRSFPPTNRPALGRLNPLGRILDKWLPPSSNVSARALPFSETAAKTKGRWSLSFASLPCPFFCLVPCSILLVAQLAFASFCSLQNAARLPLHCYQLPPLSRWKCSQLLALNAEKMAG